MNNKQTAHLTQEYDQEDATLKSTRPGHEHALKILIPSHYSLTSTLENHHLHHSQKDFHESGAMQELKNIFFAFQKRCRQIHLKH